MATTFKTYSEKSKARRALVQVHGIDAGVTADYLAMIDGKWGFHMNNETPVRTGWMFKQEEAVAEAALAPVEPVAGGSLTPDEPEADTTRSAPSAFGAFAMSQLTAPSNTAPAEPQRTSTSQRVAGLKIEKNREARNGVKMPSVGGMCRAVWDALNNMMTHDEAAGTATIPTVADIKKLAETNGWNVNNASIEYYQWRKWHGITGRGKKTT